MKRIVVKNLFDFESEVEDCFRIISAFREAGYEIYLEQAYLMWQNLSTDWDAGWLCLPQENKNIVAMLQDYFDASEADENPE